MRKARGLQWLLGCAASLLAASAPAQEVVAGDYVRLRGPELPESPMVGRVLEVRPNHLVVQFDAKYSPWVVRRASLRRLEVARGKRSVAREGLVAGAIVGGLAGAGLGLAYGTGACEQFHCAPGATTTVGAALGAGAGGLLGAGLRSEEPRVGEE